jgi:hypothetical protein
MKPIIFDITRYLLLAVAIVLMAIGIKMLPVTLFGSNTFVTEPAIDSTITRNHEVDSANQSLTVTKSVVERNYKLSKADAECPACIQLMYDNAYKYILLGIFLLAFVYLLPALSEFSLFGVFSGKLKEDIKNVKETTNKIQEAALQSNTGASTAQAIAKSDAEPDKKIMSYPDDPQKGKWGEKSETGSRKLSAIVTPIKGSGLLFNIVLKIVSTNPLNPLSGTVVFHLHDTFKNQNPEIFVVDGQATLTLVAWGAFTVGAEADGCKTKLELDLSELPEAPAVFKSR